MPDRGHQRRPTLKKAKSDYAIQTVVNALRVLEAFHDAEELGVTEISRTLDLHKNNVFRLLATLEMEGFIEQRDGDKYRLGTRCLELGRAYTRAGGDLIRRGGAVLEDLSREIGETVHLGVLRDFEVVHLAGRESQHLLRVGSRVGRRLPAHCTALGKVILACSDESVRTEYDRWLSGNGGPEGRTQATIVDRDKLFEHLRGVAVSRLALDVEECDPGLCCVAAPVFDETGVVVGALSVSGPSIRLDPEALVSDLGVTLAATADRLSCELGFSA
jgi:IclR family KDG regulon transcriptional repressor